MQSVLPVVVALAILAVGASPARAADPGEPPPASRTVARELFVSGVEAAGVERWDEAREAFERAYRLAPNPQILVNLGTAQSMTGRLVAAAESYRRFLRTAEPALLAVHEGEVKSALAELTARIPRLVIDGAVTPDDRLILDGDPLSPAAVGVPYPVDPGRHELRVERGGKTRHEATFLAEERSSLEVEVPADRGPDSALHAKNDEDPGLFARPTTWLILGGVAAVAVASVFALRGADIYGGSEDVVLRGLHRR